MRARTPCKVLLAGARSLPQFAPRRYDSTTSDPSPSASTWQPILPPGTSPAYDAALKYLDNHKTSLLAKIDQIKASPDLSAAQLSSIDALEVEAYVNDPSHRRRFRQTKGVGEFGRPIVRHLAEKAWKKEGGLDLIMGRVFQNKVVPDVLPDIPPTNPLTLSIPQGTVAPALVMQSSTFEQPPRLTFQMFQHPSPPTPSQPSPSALYSLMMVDSDSPDHETRSYAERLHYLKTNIPLSVTAGQVNLFESQGDEVVAWEPPAPPKGSGRHRYIFVLVRQSQKVEIPTPERSDFRLRSYLSTLGDGAGSVVGITLFRSEWTENDNAYINRIWRDVRGVSDGAPVYKPAPKEEKYGKPLNALGQRAAALRQRAWERSLAEYESVGLAEGMREVTESLEREVEEENLQ